MLKVITIRLLVVLLFFFKANSQFLKNRIILIFMRQADEKSGFESFIFFYEEAAFQNLNRDLERICFGGKGCHKDT